MEMRLEDLQTEEMHPVDSAGTTLGRDSRRSSIVIADPGVSGAHARIFERSGRFFIEDNNSSNGTFVEGTRLRGELELKDGFVIALHKYRFRVVLDGASVGDSTALFEPKGSKVDAPKKAMVGAATRTHARQTERQDAIENAHVDAPDEQGRSPNGVSPRRELRNEIIRDPGIDDDEQKLLEDDVQRGEERSAAQKSSVGQKSSKADADADHLKAGFGKALVYYMAAVPKMALMPKSAVATMIDEQPFKAMEKLELALWAAPPLALGSIVALIAAIIVGLVTGTFGLGSIISPLISGAITVVVGSLIAGWVWHPFMTWWIKLLKGTSDPQSRTNMMITTFTAMSLAYIAAGVGVLFTLLVRIPFIGPFVQIGPLVLTCIASLVMLYVSLVWYKYFRVSNWVPKVIVVLGVLTIANAAWGAVGFVRAGIASVGAAVASSPSTEGLTEQKEQLATAQAAAQAAGVSAQTATAQTRQATAAAQAQAVAQAQAAQAVAAQQQANSNAAARAAQAAQVQAQVAGDSGAAEPAARAESGRAESATKGAAKADTAARADTAKAEARAATSKPVSNGQPTFAEFNQRAAAIEKMIDDDPSLLSRVPGALVLYKKIHANDAKLKTKGKLDPVNERIHQAEVYSANVGAVEELYSKISAP